jgi:hypothetical protein
MNEIRSPRAYPVAPEHPLQAGRWLALSAACAHQCRKFAVRLRRFIFGDSWLLSHEGGESLWEHCRTEVKSLVLIASELRE